MMSYRFANNLWLDKLKTQLQKFSRKTPFIEPYIDRIIFYILHNFADAYCTHEKNNQYYSIQMPHCAHVKGDYLCHIQSFRRPIKNHFTRNLHVDGRNI